MTARVLLAGAGATRALVAALRAEYLTVSVAASEAVALARVEDWHPDLILLRIAGDDELPLCRRLKQEPGSRDLPLLLLSPSGDPALRLRALELGADDLAGDPPDLELLLARTRALVAGKRLLDEWRGRSEAARALGAAADARVPESVAGARALVIDDDEAAVQAVQDALARDGVLAGRAATPDQAAQLAATVAFDLIVLSLSLLTADPLRAVAELRAAPGTRHVPMLMLAGPGLRSASLRGFALGAEDCLTLPATAAELRARARTRLRRKFHQDRLRADLGLAFEMALTDPLTGCYNSRYLVRHLRGLLAAAGTPGVAVLLLDLDRFKQVNERAGYAAGDLALVQVAQALRDRIRAQDSLARSGGEEFVVVMPGCGVAEAMDAADRLRCGIETLLVPVDSGPPFALTASIGVSVSEDEPVTAERLLYRAEQALAAAQASGPNRVAGPHHEAAAAA